MILLDSIDSSQLAKIHNNSFPLPDLSSPLYIGKKSVIEHGLLAGFGLVKQTLEGILILDNNLPNLTKVRVIKSLVDSFIQDMQYRGQAECHVFVKDEHFRHVLHHLGFKECQGGTPMVIHF